MSLGILLTHGAGGNAEGALLKRLDADLSAAGSQVVRHNLAYRVLRPSGPPRRGDDVRDRAGLAAAAAELRRRCGRVVIGGQSYGGRQCSMLLAEQPALADGLITLGYPLHPPGKPEQLRTAHFPGLTMPVLMVMGDKDPFGTPEEVRAAAMAIPGLDRIEVFQGMGHSLKPTAEVSAVVLSWLKRFS